MSRNVYACWVLWFTAAALATAHADDWPVPGDPAELQRACSGRRGLETFGQNGFLGIECGYQALLLGSKLPVAPAAHVPWAKPYARAPIKLLIVTTFGNASTGSDVEQLAQVTRELQVDVRWLMVADFAVIDPQVADERYRTVFLPEQARAVLREDYDAILITFGTNTPKFGPVPAHAYFPDDVYETILDKVRRGTGLVVVGQTSGSSYWLNKTPLAAAAPAHMQRNHYRLHGDKARITKGPDGALFRGLEARPGWRSETSPLIVYAWKLREDAQVLARVDGQPLVITRQHGQGRIVLLGWDGTLGPERGAGRAELEHTTALALRALTFAARKEPQAELELTHEHLQSGTPNLLHATLDRAATLKVTVRDDTFRPLHVITHQAQPGTNALQLPGLPNGSYFLQAIASDAQGRVLNWADQQLTVECDEHLTVKTDKEIYQLGETVHISTTSALTPPLTAAFEVRDASGRVLAQETRPFSGELSFDYKIRAAPVAPHKVVVELARDGDSAPLLRATAPFFVPTAGWNDYENILWPAHRPAPTNLKLRDEGGITALFDQWGRSDASDYAAHYGQRSARINDAGLPTALLQTQPLKAAEVMSAQLPRAIESARHYGGWFWLLQNERHQMDDPGAPDAEGLARFRNYLRAHYSSLTALNQAWGTRYKTWEQIQPALTAAVQHGVDNLAPWVDFRLYVADQAFQLDKQQAKRIRDAFGADTAVGLDGFTTSRHALPYGAIDFGRLAAEGVFNFYGAYDEHFMLDSMIKGPKANYLGSTSSRADYFGLPWRDAFRGHWGSLRFFGPTYMSELGHLQPAGRWTGEGTRELRAGVGKLLMGSERELSPVAIMYSYPSLLLNSGAAYWEPRHGGAALSYSAAESRKVIEQLLWAAGVSFGYQTDVQIAQGALKGKRLLIIPRQMGVALSSATARAIELFVREGGTVLADLTPGLCDEHGKPRATGALDKLFGVQSTGEAMHHAEREFGAHLTKPHEETWLLDEWYDKRLRITDGKAQGEHVSDKAPAFVVKHSGRGRALLLNTLMASQQPDGATGWPEQHAIMRELLETCGVAPHARVEAQTGERETHCEINRFHDGANTYVGFYAHSDPEVEPEQIRARFADDKETYDVRAGRYLGRIRELPLPVRAQEAALFARLDYKLNALHMDAPPTAARGEPLELSFVLEATSRPGRHVVHVELTGPNGMALPFYKQNIVLDQGHGQLQIISALNDPKGPWQISAREVVSGLQVTRAIEVR